MRTAFARNLFFEGRLSVEAGPTLEVTAESVDALRSVLAAQHLHLPGPPLEPCLPILVEAVQVLYRLAWEILHGPSPDADADPSLRMQRGPCGPRDHVAADVAFRFLPRLHQQAHARGADAPLTRRLAELLREWPLSGVLADIPEPPLTPPEFGHVGVAFLYSERLAERTRPAWIPSGPERDLTAIVWRTLGKPPLPDEPTGENEEEAQA